MAYLLVAAFGAAGAVTRYAVDGWVSDATRGQFPWGTRWMVTLERVRSWRTGRTRRRLGRGRRRSTRGTCVSGRLETDRRRR
jgi:hypothetical protein